MTTYTVNEKEMLASLIEYAKNDNHPELAAILQISQLTYEPQYEFSNIIHNQKNLLATLRVPLKFKDKIAHNRVYLSRIACEVYIDDDVYHFCGIEKINMLAVQIEELEYKDTRILLEKDTVFSNFIKTILDLPSLNDLQQKYLFEACQCGDRGNLLAASVMLGASAEMLLIDFCRAYKNYLSNTETASAVDQYERKVINARCANDRLTEFLKRANSNQLYFKELGFENISLNFNVLDIIRETRNTSGHPSESTTISKEAFKMYLTSYQALLPKILDAIKNLDAPTTTL